MAANHTEQEIEQQVAAQMVEREVAARQQVLEAAAAEAGWADPSLVTKLIPLNTITTVEQAQAAVSRQTQESPWLAPDRPIPEDELRRRHGEEMLQGLLGGRPIGGHRI